MSVNDWLDMMPRTITVSTWIGANRFAEETYSTSGTSVRCRIERINRNVINATGETVVSSVTIYAASTSAIPLTAKVTLPDGSEPNLIQVVPHDDQDGAHHQTLYLGG